MTLSAEILAPVALSPVVAAPSGLGAEAGPKPAGGFDAALRLAEGAGLGLAPATAPVVALGDRVALTDPALPPQTAEAVVLHRQDFAVLASAQIATRGGFAAPVAQEAGAENGPDQPEEPAQVGLAQVGLAMKPALARPQAERAKPLADKDQDKPEAGPDAAFLAAALPQQPEAAPIKAASEAAPEAPALAAAAGRMDAALAVPAAPSGLAAQAETAPQAMAEDFETGLRAALAGLDRLGTEAEAVAEPAIPLEPSDLAPQDASADAGDPVLPEAVFAAAEAGPALAAGETVAAPAPAVAQTGGLAAAAMPNAPTSAPVHPTLRMDQPDWPEKLAIRLAGAFDANDANIEMQLSPEHLGPLHIRLEMKSGVAQVFVTTATPQAAEAFARAETQLSGLLAAAEVTLTGQETAQGGFADHGGQGGYHGARAHTAPRFHADPPRSAAPEANAQRLLNLIA